MGAQFVFSCYAFFFCSIEMKLPMTAAALGALLLSILFACLIEWIVYYPFYKKQASGGAVMIASLGVMIIVENIIALSFGNEVKTISNLLEPSIVWGGLRFTRIQLIHLFTGIALFCGVGVLLRHNRYFKAIWAMGDQPELIPILGLPLKRLRILIMVLGGIMIALPAMLISYDTGMNPHLGMSYLLLAAVAMFFGGADRYFAWGVGALILSILQSISIWKFSARWIELVTFGVLIFVLLFRPQGLFGTRKRLEEQS
jgi:branched-subunit amino acid ABC-type transport system permease component